MSVRLPFGSLQQCCFVSSTVERGMLKNAAAESARPPHLKPRLAERAEGGQASPVSGPTLLGGVPPMSDFCKGHLAFTQVDLMGLNQ